jgi:hypothetical protein
MKALGSQEMVREAKDNSWKQALIDKKSSLGACAFLVSGRSRKGNPGRHNYQKLSPPRSGKDDQTNIRFVRPYGSLGDCS